MAILVEIQGDEINVIEENVASAANHISGGTNGLYYADQMKRRGSHWGCWIGVFLLILMGILVSARAS